MKARRNTDSTEPARILGLNCVGPEGNKNTPRAAVRESRQDTIFGKNRGTGCSCNEEVYEELQRERRRGEEHNESMQGKAVLKKHHSTFLLELPCKSLEVVEHLKINNKC